jgi:hypothetical protein
MPGKLHVRKLVRKLLVRRQLCRTGVAQHGAAAGTSVQAAAGCYVASSACDSTKPCCILFLYRLSRPSPATVCVRHVIPSRVCCRSGRCLWC